MVVDHIAYATRASRPNEAHEALDVRRLEFLGYGEGLRRRRRRRGLIGRGPPRWRRARGGEQAEGDNDDSDSRSWHAVRLPGRVGPSVHPAPSPFARVANWWPEWLKPPGGPFQLP